MEKVDFKRTMKNLFAPPKDHFVDLEVPPLRYVMVDGAGDPNTAPAYVDALQALYSTSYAMKFAAKKTLGRDYVVPPLQGRWWSDDPDAFTRRQKDKWLWTLMIMVPDFVPDAFFEAALEKAEAKLGTALPPSLRLETLTEGRVLQCLHIGSYDDEAPKLAHLHDDLMPALGLTFNGLHHEIYLSDPRRTATERLRTVLRQPVRAA